MWPFYVALFGGYTNSIPLLSYMIHYLQLQLQYKVLFGEPFTLFSRFFLRDGERFSFFTTDGARCSWTLQCIFQVFSSVAEKRVALSSGLHHSQNSFDGWF